MFVAILLSGGTATELSGKAGTYRDSFAHHLVADIRMYCIAKSVS